MWKLDNHFIQPAPVPVGPPKQALLKPEHHKKLVAIQQVERELKEVGFSEVAIEDVSFRVAPSVLHVPFAIKGFVLKQLLVGENLNGKACTT
ncbi:hypothetical protein FK220_002925 [Flavobacteriaceae bacterium TP-CH-4]|uniref:Uncharacterized protein n=1 Tax=Pelagihabitans pacificus TaxID=2696054 RepID=A0A967ARR6_9FLAO|nr:hypothetical protein [Pelagihabitans pacificus]NHF58280.1 hypothetical protein [Pelagihabitans pacificus]